MDVRSSAGQVPAAVWQGSVYPVVISGVLPTAVDWAQLDGVQRTLGRPNIHPTQPLK